MARTTFIAPARRPSSWVSRTKPERGFSGRCGELIAILPSPAAPILVVAEVQPYRRVGNGAKLCVISSSTSSAGSRDR